ncbi:collagen alpha-1(I) chain-like [Talpa occidentalis]|uniref:collagen alpha-1(I) chain-like n=1 Tax=Talpa occidentalis TaxID=50954 RepID=UPI0018903A36|nr:collagen alpha-1(I) chain-like [Talpa occidentalis]
MTLSTLAVCARPGPEDASGRASFVPGAWGPPTGHLLQPLRPSELSWPPRHRPLLREPRLRCPVPPTVPTATSPGAPAAVQNRPPLFSGRLSRARTRGSGGQRSEGARGATGHSGPEPPPGRLVLAGRPGHAAPSPWTPDEEPRVTCPDLGSVPGWQEPEGGGHSGPECGRPPRPPPVPRGTCPEAAASPDRAEGTGPSQPCVALPPLPPLPAGRLSAPPAQTPRASCARAARPRVVGPTANTRGGELGTRCGPGPAWGPPRERDGEGGGAGGASGTPRLTRSREPQTVKQARPRGSRGETTRGDAGARGSPQVVQAHASVATAERGRGAPDSKLGRLWAQSGRQAGDPPALLAVSKQRWKRTVRWPPPLPGGNTPTRPIRSCDGPPARGRPEGEGPAGGAGAAGSSPGSFTVSRTPTGPATGPTARALGSLPGGPRGALSCPLWPLRRARVPPGSRGGSGGFGGREAGAPSPRAKHHRFGLGPLGGEPARLLRLPPTSREITGFLRCPSPLSMKALPAGSPSGGDTGFPVSASERFLEASGAPGAPSRRGLWGGGGVHATAAAGVRGAGQDAAPPAGPAALKLAKPLGRATGPTPNTFGPFSHFLARIKTGQAEVEGEKKVVFAANRLYPNRGAGRSAGGAQRAEREQHRPRRGSALWASPWAAGTTLRCGGRGQRPGRPRGLFRGNIVNNHKTTKDPQQQDPKEENGGVRLPGLGLHGTVRGVDTGPWAEQMPPGGQSVALAPRARPERSASGQRQRLAASTSGQRRRSAPAPAVRDKAARNHPYGPGDPTVGIAPFHQAELLGQSCRLWSPAPHEIPLSAPRSKLGEQWVGLEGPGPLRHLRRGCGAKDRQPPTAREGDEAPCRAHSPAAPGAPTEALVMGLGASGRSGRAEPSSRRQLWLGSVPPDSPAN